MNFTETLKLAVSSILGHKLRSFLTLLGMIIGMTAFMLILSLLLGFNEYVNEKVAGIGSNAFTVQRFNFEDFKDSDTIAEAQRRNKELSFDELDFIKERAQLVENIGARSGRVSRSIKVGNNSIQSVRINGVSPLLGQLIRSTYKRPLLY